MGCISVCGLERYFFSYAVLNKLNAFFADPKESRIHRDKTKEKKKVMRLFLPC